MKLFKLGLFSLVLVGLFLFLYFQNIKRQVQLIKISPVQISQLEDGQYYGSYQVGPVYVESQTSIQAGEMTAVEIFRHDNGLGDEAE
ncbi:hypothetical protein HPK04_14555, partial [Anoxybacillus flavithermus]|nr:hypothetical protein [Anoxybacillus flavithermus]